MSKSTNNMYLLEKYSILLENIGKITVNSFFPSIGLSKNRYKYYFVD